MQTNSRRAVIATALAGLAAGCAPVALASEGIAIMATPFGRGGDPDAELMRAGAEFDRIRADYDTLNASYDAASRLATSPHAPELGEIGGRLEDMGDTMEDAAHRVMAIQPMTLTGLALWARIMCWRFDADLRGIPTEVPTRLAEFGVNEAFAIAVAIQHMASAEVAS